MKVSEELKRKYLERRVQEIRHLFESLEHEDFVSAERLGHQVKGNASTFDIPQIMPLGIEIEKAAMNKDKALVVSLLHKMCEEIGFVTGGYVQ